MNIINIVRTLTATITLLMVACGGNGTNLNESGDTSQFNPELEGIVNTGEPGGDITAIAGLWDGTTNNGEASDVVYWSFAADGVLTRYDFQQDGIPSASGENCYLVSDPVTVTPEGGDDYSISNVAVTAVVSDESLSVTFLEADKNDLDENGNTEETPVFTWTRLNSPALEDLNSCTPSVIDTDDSAGDAPLNPFIPDPPTDAVSLSTFFNGSFDGEAMTGGGFTLLEQAGSALHVRGIWGKPNSYYEVDIALNETTDGTYPLGSNSGGIYQIIGGDAVADSYSISGEASDTITFSWDKEAGLISGNFAFTAVGDDSSRVTVSGEFNTAIGRDGNSWHCNFDDEIISICWFDE